MKIHKMFSIDVDVAEALKIRKDLNASQVAEDALRIALQTKNEHSKDIAMMRLKLSDLEKKKHSVDVEKNMIEAELFKIESKQKEDDARLKFVSVD